MNDAVSKSGSQREKEDACAADDAALGARPAGQFAHHRKNVLAHAENSGQRSKDHEQEEHRAPDTAACHVIENARHGVKQQARACVDLQTIGRARREDDEACQNGDKRIEHDDVDRLTHQRVVLVDIAAENRHAAHTGGQGEERLIHSADDNRTIDLGKVRRKVEGKSVCRAVEQRAVNRKHKHEHEQSTHHIFCDPLETLLNIAAQNEKGNSDRDKQKYHVDNRVGDHGSKAEGCGLTGEEFHKIIDDPAGNDAVECHDGNIADQTDRTPKMPFLTGLFELAVHTDRTGLRGSADRKFHDHSRDSEHDQTDEIDQHEAASAVLTAHPRKFPYISAADRTAGGKHDEAHAASKTLTFH